MGYIEDPPHALHPGHTDPSIIFGTRQWPPFFQYVRPNDSKGRFRVSCMSMQLLNGRVATAVAVFKGIARVYGVNICASDNAVLETLPTVAIVRFKI
jgi:hypothetical protein